MNGASLPLWGVGLVLVAAYLWGAFPTSYIVVKSKKGIDVRTTGSGNVGSTNVVMHLGMTVGLLVGTFDALGKGMLPVILARMFGLSPSLQVGIGLAAIAGHNWSPYLKFTGGRGIAVLSGTVLGFLPMTWSVVVVALVVAVLIGRLITKLFAFWSIIAIALFAPVAYLVNASPYIVWFNAGVFGLIAGKRLTANWERPAAGLPIGRVFWYRFLYDRDVASHTEWISRGLNTTYRPRTR